MNRIKLFCLPYAGGSAVIYRKWKKYLYDSIDICPVELKGRGNRFSEPFYSSFEEAVEDLYAAIEPQIANSKYAFFGHSMGTVLVYELVNRIKKLKHQQPIHIFFSGRYPPHTEKKGKILHRLPEDEFIKEIDSYGGTPKEIFENKDLLDIFLPVLRADYRILESYNISKRQAIYDFNISVLGGKDDKEVSSLDLREWYKYTSMDCRIYEFDGGHFFINDFTEDIVNIINSTLIREEDDTERIYRVLFD